MTKDQALKMIEQYADEFALHGCRDSTIVELPLRFPEDGSVNKAMRWLGFIQGCAFALELFTLAELKEHSKRGSVR